jgi:hypothetical protein
MEQPNSSKPQHNRLDIRNYNSEFQTGQQKKVQQKRNYAESYKPEYCAHNCSSQRAECVFAEFGSLNKIGVKLWVYYFLIVLNKIGVKLCPEIRFRLHTSRNCSIWLYMPRRNDSTKRSIACP